MFQLKWKRTNSMFVIPVNMKIASKTTGTLFSAGNPIRNPAIWTEINPFLKDHILQKLFLLSNILHTLHKLILCSHVASIKFISVIFISFSISLSGSAYSIYSSALVQLLV